MENSIDSSGLSLSEFLEVLFSKQAEKLFPGNHFPTEEMLNEYLSTIHERSDNEIRALLRRFIIHSCTFGKDIVMANVVTTAIKEGKKDMVENI